MTGSTAARNSKNLAFRCAGREAAARGAENAGRVGSTWAWRGAAETFAAYMRDKVVPRDVLDLATRERDAYRRRVVPGGGK